MYRYADGEGEPEPLSLTGIALRYAIGLAVVVAALMAGSTVEAHEGAGGAEGLIAGLTHPLLGLDHLVAMVAVGLWGAFLGMPAVWLLPMVFPLIMALAALAGMSGMPLPGAEIGIALSAIVIGLAIAMMKRAPLPAAVLIVGLFAIFHGHAHGVELPEAAHPFAYAAGFVAMTGLLHIGGILLGLLIAVPAGLIAVRAIGAGIAAVGLLFLTGVV
ncbi:MAG: HupE/UreJ family protein [Rhodospirillales bacterium]